MTAVPETAGRHARARDDREPAPRRRARPARAASPSNWASRTGSSAAPGPGRATACTRSSPARRRPGPVPTDADFAILVEHGPEALATADTVVVPASYELGPGLRGGPAHRRAGRRPRPHPARHPAGLHLHRQLRPRRRRLARRPPRHHPLVLRRPLPAALPAVRVDPDVLFIDDGDVLTSAGRRRRDRPVPAHRAPRPRHGRRQRGRPAHASYRRTGTAGRRSTSSGPSPNRSWRPRPPPAPGRWAGCDEPIQLRDMARAGVDERTDVHPPLPRGGRRQPRPVADAAARGAGPASAGGHGPVGRPGGAGRGLRHGASMRQHLQAALGVPPTAYRRTFRAATAA